jgi:hypothetical protein
MSKVKVGRVVFNPAVGLPNYRETIAEVGNEAEGHALLVEWQTLYEIIEGGTREISRRKTGLALREAKRKGEEVYALAVFIAKWKRACERRYVTVNQRHWQGKCRSEARAKHHDSVSIREKYVRCMS